MNREQPRQIALGWVMFALILSQFIWLYLSFALAQIISVICVFALLLAGHKGLKSREIYLIVVCLILAGMAFFISTDASAWVFDGLSRAAYLASFILLMALLREGALESSSVLKLGHFLTLQPPKRRFVAVFSGAHALAVMINLGALSLFAPIIQRGVRANLPNVDTVGNTPLDAISAIRERRQLSATLRGFSWFLVWAPTAVTQAVMPTLMSGIDALRLIGLGLLLALIMLMVSWLEDWIRWSGLTGNISQPSNRTSNSPEFPRNAARNFLLVCAALFVLSISFSSIATVSIVTGVMLTAPFVVLIWVYIQQRHLQGMKGVGMRFKNITFCGLPAYVRESIFVACAGFIGTVGAQLIPVAEFAALIGLDSIPGWLILLSLSLIVLFFGQVGLSPITMAIFLGSVVAQVPVLPVDMTHAALAIAAGTAICTTGAPFSSGALMLSRATGYSTFTLTWKWNGAYTIAVTSVLALFYIGLTHA